METKPEDEPQSEENLIPSRPGKLTYAVGAGILLFFLYFIFIN